MSYSLQLLPGKNLLRFSCENSEGIQSSSLLQEVICQKDPKRGRLYAVAIGVSDYAGTGADLTCAARDATDLIATLKNAAANGIWEGFEPLCLTDSAVTGTATKAMAEHLSRAKPGDTVILFAAGHGELDDQGDYWFATHEFDFQRPGSAGGIRFAQLETLLAECPASNKLGLLDTCHAGELTESEHLQLASAASGLAARGVKILMPGRSDSRGTNPRSLSIEGVAESFFTSSSSASGATFIVSSGGAEFAYESDKWRNGAFTWALLRALQSPSADTGRDGWLDPGELFDFCEAEVLRLTAGLQRPRLRGYNQDNAFNLIKYK